MKKRLLTIVGGVGVALVGEATFGNMTLASAANPLQQRANEPVAQYIRRGWEDSAQPLMGVVSYNLKNLFKPKNLAQPAAQKKYQTHLQKDARVIVEQSHCPNVVVLQEVGKRDDENEAGELRADGIPDVMVDLARTVNAEAARRGLKVAYRPVQTAVGHITGDKRGITVWILYDALRTRPLGVPLHLNADASPAAQQDGQGQRLFTRPPLFQAFQLFSVGLDLGPSEEIVIGGIHYKSEVGSSDNVSFVQRRTEQARHTREMIDMMRHSGNKQRHVILLGDGNVDNNDPARRQQLADLVGYAQNGTRLADLGRMVSPRRDPKTGQTQRYTHIYNDDPYMLDMAVATPELARKVVAVSIPKIIAGKQFENDPATVLSASDHNPLIVWFHPDADTASARANRPRVKRTVVAAVPKPSAPKYTPQPTVGRRDPRTVQNTTGRRAIPR